MIEQIYDESNSCEKITLVGHSAGTMQMFNFLAKASQADRYIAQMVAMEPCLVASTDEYFEGMSDWSYRGLSLALSAFDINSLFGPTWQENVANVCELVGEDDEVCL